MLRVPATTSSPWELERKSPEGLGRPGGLVAGEGDPRARGLAAVAERHPLDVDRRPPVVGDPLQPPVGARPPAVPGLEHGDDRLAQLLARVLREGLAGLGDDLLEALAERASGPRRRARCRRFAPAASRASPSASSKSLDGEPADDAAEHLQQPPVGVPGKARVVGALGEPPDRLVAEAEVEHRVEHPRHRDARSRADRDQQRILGVAEALLRGASRAARAPRRPRRSSPSGSSPSRR